MNYKGSLYFNYPAFNDTIFIVIDNESVADNIVKNGDFVGLYKNDKLIGVNIFNSNKYIKLKINGQLKAINPPLQVLFNSIISAYLNEDVELVNSVDLLAKVVSKKEDNYIINIGDNKNQIASSLTNIDDCINKYVLVVNKDAFLENGDKASKYILKDASYLIIGVEDEEFINQEVGTPTYFVM